MRYSTMKTNWMILPFVLLIFLQTSYAETPDIAVSCQEHSKDYGSSSGIESGLLEDFIECKNLGVDSHHEDRKSRQDRRRRAAQEFELRGEEAILLFPRADPMDTSPDTGASSTRTATSTTTAPIPQDTDFALPDAPAYTEPPPPKYKDWQLLDSKIEDEHPSNLFTRCQKIYRLTGRVNPGKGKFYKIRFEMRADQWGIPEIIASTWINLTTNSVTFKIPESMTKTDIGQMGLWAWKNTILRISPEKAAEKTSNLRSIMFIKLRRETFGAARSLMYTNPNHAFKHEDRYIFDKESYYYGSKSTGREIWQKLMDMAEMAAVNELLEENTAELGNKEITKIAFVTKDAPYQKKALSDVRGVVIVIGNKKSLVPIAE